MNFMHNIKKIVTYSILFSNILIKNIIKIIHITKINTMEAKTIY